MRLYCSPFRSANASKNPWRREDGAILPVVALGLPALLLMLVLVMDFGRITTGREQLQSVADAAARGALPMATRSGRVGAAQFAQELARGSSVIDGGIELDRNQDIEWGTYNFQTGQFTASGSDLGPPPQAVRVTARRQSDAPSGSLRGLFGSLDVQAGAVASYRCRDVVLVQDTSHSFLEEIDRARAGLVQIVDALAVSGPDTARVGLVSFRAQATVELGMTPVPAETQRVRGAIQSLTACPSFVTCSGTNPGHGLHLAIEMLEASPSSCEADPLIVLISDGVPCGPDGTTLLPPIPAIEPYGRRAGALDRVALARSKDLSISPILLSIPGGTGCQTPQGPVLTDPVFNARLAAGFGQPAVVSRASDLPDVLLGALGSFPVVLVR